MHTQADSPEVNVSMKFQIQGVLITLDWIPQMGVTYNVTTTPAIDVRFFERASANLSLSYNTAYNVTVEATSLCKETNTTLKEFNYCELLLELNLGDWHYPNLMSYQEWEVGGLEGFRMLKIVELLDFGFKGT